MNTAIEAFESICILDVMGHGRGLKWGVCMYLVYVSRYVML